MGKNSKNNSGTKKRIFWLDVLRALSILAVVTIHVSVQNWEKVTVGSDSGTVFAVFDGMARFAVPVFVMISGALMLSRDIKFRKCLAKVGRLTVVWVFWCVFYATMTLLAGKGREAALHDLVFGHFHMWFLPMIAALYLATPILRLIARNQRWCVVVIIVLLIISVGLKFRWTAYPMYYLMGYILGNSDLLRERKRILTMATMGVLFLVSAVAIAGLNIRASLAAEVAIHPEDADWSILTIIQSMAVFVGVKYFAGGHSKNVCAQKICSQLAGDVLGVYLVHIAVLGLLNRIGISNMMFSGGVGAGVGTMLTIILTGGVSIVIIELMRRIPVVRRVV